MGGGWSAKVGQNVGGKVGRGDALECKTCGKKDHKMITSKKMFDITESKFGTHFKVGKRLESQQPLEGESV